MIPTDSSRENENAAWWQVLLPAAAIALLVFNSNYQSIFAETASGISIETADLSEAESETSSDRQLLILAFGGLGVLFALIAKRQTVIYLPLAISIAMLLFIVAASTVWSDEPGYTLRRSIIIFLVAIGTFGVGRHWSLMDLCRATWLITSAFIAVSLLLDIKAGTFLRGEYRFSGAFHPNRQALICCFFTLSNFAFFRDRKNWLYLAMVLVGLLLVKLTGSRGGLVGVVLAIASGFFIGLSPRNRLLTCFAAMFLFGATLLLLSLSGYTIPTGDDVSKSVARSTESDDSGALTGRIPIWIECTKAMSERPITGYGYGAFWSAARIQEYSLIHEWAFSNAHSIYFETALNVGLVGLAILFAVVIISIIKALQIRKAVSDAGSLFFISLIVLGAINGFVEAIYVSVGLESILVGVGCMILMTGGASGSSDIDDDEFEDEGLEDEETYDQFDEFNFDDEEHDLEHGDYDEADDIAQDDWTPTTYRH